MNKINRSKQAMINVFVVVLMQILSTIYSLLTKRFFLDSFSISSYGVIDLFGTFFRSLMLLELGFGTILIYNLYNPLANNDICEIKKQMSYFKTIYSCISIIVVTISLVTGFFLFDIFNIALQDKALVYEIYALNIINVLVKYHFLYKTSILNAGNCNYVSNVSYMIVEALGFVCKMISIIVIKSEALYIACLLLIPTLTYFCQSFFATKIYNIKKVGYASFREIKNSGVLIQCKNYMLASAYALVFNSMDNIIISMKLSTDSIAFVSNYLALFLIGREFLSSLSYSLRGIMADYYNSNADDLSFYKVFDIVSAFNFIICSIVCIGFYLMINDFIALWLGEKYIIEQGLIIVLLVNNMIEGFFSAIENVFVIKGYIFKQKIPLVVSACSNIILTIILLDYLGLIGAYIATFISVLILCISKFLYIIYGVFKKYSVSITVKYILYFLMTIIEAILLRGLLSNIFLEFNLIVQFGLKTLTIIIVIFLLNTLIIILINKNMREYIKNMIKTMIN